MNNKYFCSFFIYIALLKFFYEKQILSLLYISCYPFLNFLLPNIFILSIAISCYIFQIVLIIISYSNTIMVSMSLLALYPGPVDSKLGEHCDLKA